MQYLSQKFVHNILILIVFCTVLHWLQFKCPPSSFVVTVTGTVSTYYYSSVGDPDPDCRIRIFLGLPDPDSLVTSTNPDPSIIKQK
jgi:hypothetical protein